MPVYQGLILALTFVIEVGFDSFCQHQLGTFPFDESAHMLFDESAGICFRSICKQILHLSAIRQGISNVLDQLFIQWHSINRHFKGYACN